jgi:glycosyltransferase involved in cell wall biosynthesis
MNILHINDKVEIRGGVEVYIEQMMELLPQYDYQSHWLGIYKEDNHYHIKEYQKTDIAVNQASLTQVVQYIKGYKAKHGIHIIHIHSLSNPSLIEALFEVSPVVRSMHEPRIVCPGQGKFWRKSERICDKPFGKHCIYHAFKEGCCNRHPKRLLAAIQNVAFETTRGKANYKAIIAMSYYMMQEAKNAGYKDSQLFLNPLFTPHINDDELIDTSDAPIKRILFVGRLSKTKGVHYLIDAAKKLLINCKQIRVDIVGRGHHEAYFKSLVPRELSDYFVFHGWKNREEVHQLVSNAYIVMFPSIYPEAFGISGIEAMMRGKPVVGFDVGGVTTWLKDGKTGFAVPVKDSQALADKIDLLLTDKKIYQEQSKNARVTALKEFSPNVHLNKLKNIYTYECR